MLNFDFEIHDLADICLRMFGDVMSGYIFLNSITESTGKDLFRVSEIDMVIKRAVKDSVFCKPFPHIEDRWKAVLAIRLLFAYDVCSGSEYRRLYANEAAIFNLVYIMTIMWGDCGLEWLLCRSKFPMLGCSLGDELREITQRMSIREGIHVSSMMKD